MKIYTAVQRILTSGNTIAHLNVDGDMAFTSNARLTTYKRLIAEQVGLVLTNWSYRVATDYVAPGSKIYTIQQKVVTPDGTLYLAMTDVGYRSKREAKFAIDNVRLTYPDATLCIFSFIVDADQQVIDHGPVPAAAYDDDDDEIHDQPW